MQYYFLLYFYYYVLLVFSSSSGVNNISVLYILSSKCLTLLTISYSLFVLVIFSGIEINTPNNFFSSSRRGNILSGAHVETSASAS